MLQPGTFNPLAMVLRVDPAISVIRSSTCLEIASGLLIPGVSAPLAYLVLGDVSGLKLEGQGQQ